MNEPSKWICADCETGSESGKVPCPKCGSFRVIVRSVYEEVINGVLDKGEPS
jgi:Zn finger protein HypA/HybF involved in hydrogenase expression